MEMSNKPVIQSHSSSSQLKCKHNKQLKKEQDNNQIEIKMDNKPEIHSHSPLSKPKCKYVRKIPNHSKKGVNSQ